MAFCRFGLLRRCSGLQVSSLSLGALGQNCPSQYLMTQDSHSGVMQSQASNLTALQNLIRYSQVTTDNVQSCAHRPTFLSEPLTLSAGILDSFLLQSQLSQNSGTSRDIQKYICPSRLSHTDVNIVILDNIASVTSFYECPVSTVIDNMTVPSKEKSEILEGPGKISPKMEARIIMRIRHKKMKKHKLKKLRKRMYFLWSKYKKARKAKRLKLYRAELEQIKTTGDNFDAVNYVQEQIAKAKKGGYFINVLDSKPGH